MMRPNYLRPAPMPRGIQPRSTLKSLGRVLEAWMLENLTLSAIVLFLSGPILALPFAVWFWFAAMEGMVVEAEMRAEQRGRNKQVVITLSQTDKNCLEWREVDGGWRCVAR